MDIKVLLNKLNKEELQDNIKYLEEIKTKINKLTKKTDCFTCCDENEQYIIYECYHVISICDNCYDKLTISNSCPICRKVSLNIKKCYVI